MEARKEREAKKKAAAAAAAEGGAAAEGAEGGDAKEEEEEEEDMENMETVDEAPGDETAGDELDLDDGYGHIEEELKEEDYEEADES